jgi:hypothetical protein
VGFSFLKSGRYYCYGYANFSFPSVTKSFFFLKRRKFPLAGKKKMKKNRQESGVLADWAST